VTANMSVSDEKEKSIFRYLSEYDRRIIYFLLFIVVVGPLISPIAMPISVSPDSKQYYDVLRTLGSNDIVLTVLDTEFSGYMELQSGVIASTRMIIEKESKMAVAISHPEATIIPDILFGALKDLMDAHHYTYGDSYLVLGYIYQNEASVASSAEDFQGFVRQDWQGRPIKGTFLEQVRSWKDISLIVSHTTGILSGSVMNHFALRGTRMIVNCIGGMIPGQKTYLNTGILKAVLPAMRGGAELESLIGIRGLGTKAMDAFTLGHYMLIAFIIIGNIGYFGYARPRAQKARTGG